MKTSSLIITGMLRKHAPFSCSTASEELPLPIFIFPAASLETALYHTLAVAFPGKAPQFPGKKVSPLAFLLLGTIAYCQQS